MPLIRIALRAGKPEAYRNAICDSLYGAMRETFDVPENDRFMIVSEHDGADFHYDRTYGGVARSDDFVLIQIVASDTRSLEQKKALFRRIAERLGESPGVRPDDVFVNLVEVARANWSFGHGLAQYA